jgi:hypothetical protein
MKRKVLIALLALGSIGGFAAGFASLRCRHHARRAAMEQKVTQICADALRQAQTK